MCIRDSNGGYGRNTCSHITLATNCNGDSPGPPSPNRPFVNFTADGVLTVLGSQGSDTLDIARGDSGYVVTSSIVPEVRGCATSGTRTVCDDSRARVNSIIVYGNSGNDSITIDYSVPADTYTLIDAGNGDNVVKGGKTSDYIATGHGNSRLEGRDGHDVITPGLASRTTVLGGSGHDVIKTENPCLGHSISGGSGKDNVVMARSDFGIHVDLGKGFIKRNGGGSCNPTKLAADIEDAEGSRYNDIFVASRRGSGFLGRQGIDSFLTRDGRGNDSIITGPGGRKNRISRDPGDKLVYGWGLARA